MFRSTGEDYSKFCDVEIDKKLEPINLSIDEMLLRLEEFEAMVALVQQERCNAIGLTGSLTESMDFQTELKELCTRIDALEKLIEYIKMNINSLEHKMDIAEEQFGLVDNANKLKNFFMPLFKKSPEVKVSVPIDASTEAFSIDKYFANEEERID